MKRRRVVGLSLALLVFALLVASAQAGATKPQLGKVKQTARPIPVLAMDGPRVAYMMNDRRVGVWNVVTGGTSMIKGKYPTKGASFGYGSGEVAIAGKRVALSHVSSSATLCRRRSGSTRRRSADRHANSGS